MPTRADTHDLDKLKRWQKDLVEDTPHAPAVYALFLVSGEDTVAHDVFRKFRTSFEAREAGFAHLVIFGQHGISSTARAFQQELGLAENPLPTLVIFGGDTDDGEYITADVISLPRGKRENVELRDAYWWAEMYWSDEILAAKGNELVFLRTNVIDPLPDDTSDDNLEPSILDMGEALQWAEDKMEDSIAAAGPPELNRVLKKRLTDLCAWVLDAVGG